MQLVVWFWKTFWKGFGNRKDNAKVYNATDISIYIDAVKCWKSKFRGMRLNWTDDSNDFCCKQFYRYIRTGGVLIPKLKQCWWWKQCNCERKYLLLWNGSCNSVIWCLFKPNHSLTHFKAWRHGHSCLLSIVSSHHRCGFFSCSTIKLANSTFGKPAHAKHTRKWVAQCHCCCCCCSQRFMTLGIECSFSYFFETFLVVFASNRNCILGFRFFC